jgi:hypothetical protein
VAPYQRDFPEAIRKKLQRELKAAVVGDVDGRSHVRQDGLVGG